MNDAPSSTSRTDVTPIAWRVFAASSGTGSGQCGLVIRWTAASAPDSVLVMTKSVAANPSSTRTSSLPFHQDSNRSSIASEPWPCGLSRATRR